MERSLESVYVTQDELRNADELHQMVEFIKNGGVFDFETIQKHEPGSVLVDLSVFEDGLIYLHNGHHRAVACWLGGRPYLLPQEVRIRNWKYSQYKEIVFLTSSKKWLGWVTPFDPRSEIRVADLSGFKNKVQDIFYSQSEQHATHFILTKSELYKTPRKLSFVPELAEKYARIAVTTGLNRETTCNS